MKITAIRPYVMWSQDAARNWAFVKVETDEGVHGWGESSLIKQEPTIAQAVDQLAPQVIGDDPAGIERIWQKLWLHNRYRGGVIIMSALSAIHRPVGHQGQGPRRSGLPAPRRRREAVGTDVDIMIDCHGKSRPALALKQIRAIDDLGLLLFEEPVPTDNVDALQPIRRAGFKTEIATGERMLSRWASATIPNFLSLEHVWPHPLFDEVQVEPLTRDGSRYGLPVKPGLGVDLREGVIAANPPKYRPVYQSFSKDGTPAET